MSTHHPIQPLSNEDGVLRFKKNSIVVFLLDNGGFDLNKLARMDFSKEDREQFAQLIGYSLSGFGELSYVSDETYSAAEKISLGESELQARIDVLEQVLRDVRDGLRKVVPAVFRIHPDDLEF